MLKTLAVAAALGFSGAAIAQQAQPGPAKPDAKGESPTAPESSAAGGTSRSACDVVGADIIKGCLKRQESGSSDAANEFKDPKQPPR